MTINEIEKVLFTGQTHTTAASRGGERVDIKLTTPGNPANAIGLQAVQAHPAAEQLFAGAWSACYTGALNLVAGMKKVTLPPEMAVDIEVDLGMTGNAYFIRARIDVYMPGVAQDVAEAIAQAAHGVCPYSKAVHGNIDVSTNVFVADAVAA